MKLGRLIGILSILLQMPRMRRLWQKALRRMLFASERKLRRLAADRRVNVQFPGGRLQKISGGRAFRNQLSEPVSYTHLDVYKRQAV